MNGIKQAIQQLKVRSLITKVRAQDLFYLSKNPKKSLFSRLGEIHCKIQRTEKEHFWD